MHLTVRRCSIFNAYIGSGLHPVLYQTINPPSSSSEPVTPAQTALLKLVDAHLSSHHANPPLSPDDFLLPAFERMQMYAVASLSSGLDDARLPKVLEGLVLVLEGLGSIGLACQGRSDRSEPGGGEEELVKRMKAPDTGMVGPVIGQSQLRPGTAPEFIMRFGLMSSATQGSERLLAPPATVSRQSGF